MNTTNTHITLKILGSFIIGSILFAILEVYIDHTLTIKSLFYLLKDCNLDWSLITSPGVIVLTFFIFSAAYFAYNFVIWLKKDNHTIKLLWSIVLLLWVTGWGLYMQALIYRFHPTEINNIDLLFRPAIASLDNFIIGVNSSILDAIKGHEHLKGAISFVGVLSILTTTSLFISIILFRLHQFRMLKGIRINKKCPHLYIFFGINDAAISLSKSINENDKSGKNIILIDNNCEDAKQYSLQDRLIGSVNTYDKSLFKEEPNLYFSSTNFKLFDTLSEHTEDIDIFSYLGLSTIKEKINNLKKIQTDAELHIFFLSDNENANLQCIELFQKDETLQYFNQDPRMVKTTLYCHAKYSERSKSIETKYTKEYTDQENKEHIEKNIKLQDYKIRTIDSSRLATFWLKQQPYLHPVNYVDVNPDATVSSNFDSLIVGFGETGRNVLKFLYEYGAFVNSDKSHGIRRSPFTCHVFDTNMEAIAPAYMSKHLRPSTGQTRNITFNDSKETLVNLHSANYNSLEFEEYLNKHILSLNYIAIAVGDDKNGINLAIKIIKGALREGRTDFRRFKIIIRTSQAENFNYIRAVAERYNNLILEDETLLNTDEPIITLFGMTHKKQGSKKDVEEYDIFNYKMIIDDEIQKNANKFHEQYEFHSQKNEDSPPKQSLIGGINNSWRKNSQNIENVLHLYTEIRLAELSNPTLLETLPNIIKKHKKENENKNVIDRDQLIIDIEQTLSQPEIDLLNTLSQTEHLRWNASHEMLGYILGEKQDHILLMHNCLTDWECLTDKYKGYDYDVVFTSFLINSEEHEQES